MPDLVVSWPACTPDVLGDVVVPLDDIIASPGIDHDDIEAIVVQTVGRRVAYLFVLRHTHRVPLRLIGRGFLPAPIDGLVRLAPLFEINVMDDPTVLMLRHRPVVDRDFVRFLASFESTQLGPPDEAHSQRAAFTPQATVLDLSAQHLR